MMCANARASGIGGVFMFEKCLKNELKSSKLETACTNLKGPNPSAIENLMDILTRKECGADNPEDCSNCVAKKMKLLGKPMVCVNVSLVIVANYVLSEHITEMVRFAKNAQNCLGSLSSHLFSPFLL